MPQVVLLAALGAGLYAGIRALTRFGNQIAAELKAREDAVRQRAHAKATMAGKDLGTLELDPQSGIYKPADRRA